ncbi:MAG: 16S rRNA (cytosine(1402)-N(4))-methyltransferase RsmH [Anaerolineaceae bacterium]|jgi:16S rRNA (cytosine1402-N4)-methyltransferase
MEKIPEPSPHLPVLYHEILNYISPISSGRYVDATLGAGGHAWGILDASAPDGKLLGLDIDPQALAIAQQRLKFFKDRAILVQASYQTLVQQIRLVGWENVNGIVMDLGVSSMQIDTPERGFSFQQDGPLDMRFGSSQTISAEELINTTAEKDLADLIWRYGEERQSRRIAHAIIQARPIHTTLQLAEIVKQAYKGPRGKLHPATRTFQAIRIAVNDELSTLEKTLPNAISALAPGGKLAIISFHSLEDRLVKQFFRLESKDCICPPDQPVCTCNHKATINDLTRHPVESSEEEKEKNPRARSARLRIAEKRNLA